MSLMDALRLAQDRATLSDKDLLAVYGVLRDAARENAWSGCYPKLGSTINANIGHHQAEMGQRGLSYEPVFH